jgi:uncharacterized membrane protein YeiH
LYSEFLNIIDILGTFAFAVSGAMSAMEKKLDAFGILIISFVTAIGGGTIRDILVGNLPVNWLQNNTAILIIFSAAVLSMLFGRHFRQLNKALFLFDALGLGFFTIIGIEIGLKSGFSPGVCIALGTISACFGGVLRDVLLNKLPLIFHKEIYALACIIGGIVYYFMKKININEDISKVVCILLIFAIRLIAYRFKLSLPRMVLK